MKPVPFAYTRPDNIDELCQLLAQHGEDARIIAGGLSLGAMLNMRLVTPKVLVDIGRIDALKEIDESKSYLRTGALFRQADAMTHPAVRKAVPLLCAALTHVGHYQTRSRGTLGGSVAHADPSAEIPLVLFTLDGEVELRSSRRTRYVKARDFFTAAMITAKAPDEAVTALRWPISSPGTRHAFRELALRAGDYAVVAGACQGNMEPDGRLKHLSLAFGGCSDRPQLVDVAPYIGQHLNEASIAAISEAAKHQVECKDDLHAHASYRRQLVGLFAQDMLRQIATPEGEEHDPT